MQQDILVVEKINTAKTNLNRRKQNVARAEAIAEAIAEARAEAIAEAIAEARAEA